MNENTDMTLFTDVPLAVGERITMGDADAWLVKVQTRGAPRKVIAWSRKPLVLPLDADAADLEQALLNSDCAGVREVLLYPYSRTRQETLGSYIRHLIQPVNPGPSPVASHYPEVLEVLTKTIGQLTETIHNHSLTTCETNRALATSITEQTRGTAEVITATAAPLRVLSDAKRPLEPEKLDVEGLANAVQNRWEKGADNEPDRLLELAKTPLGTMFSQLVTQAIVPRLAPKPKPAAAQPPAARPDSTTVSPELIDAIRTLVVNDVQAQIAGTLRNEIAAAVSMAVEQAMQADPDDMDDYEEVDESDVTEPIDSNGANDDRQVEPEVTAPEVTEPMEPVASTAAPAAGARSARRDEESRRFDRPVITCDVDLEQLHRRAVFVPTAPPDDGYSNDPRPPPGGHDQTA